MQGKHTVFMAGRVAAFALLFGPASHALAGNYHQTLSVSGMSYAIEDLDANDGVTSTYKVYQKSQQVLVRSSLPGHEAHSELNVTTLRNKPLSTAFTVPDVNAAASNNGTGDSTVSAGLTLDMADYPSWTSVGAHSSFDQAIELSPHSAITITATVEHSWLYEGALGPLVPGEISPQLQLSGGLSLSVGGDASDYSFQTLTDSSGSKTTTLTFRYANPYDNAYRFWFTTEAFVSMQKADYWIEGLSTPNLAAVPEPATMGMLLAGMPLVLLAARRRRNAVKRGSAQLR